MRRFWFSPALPRTPAFTAGDGLIVLGLVAMLYAGGRLALHAPPVVRGPDISLSLSALPWYALLSCARMAVAYALSLLFSLVYGYAAARNRTAEKVLMPLLDVLQSVPILSFMPVVLLSLSAVLPESIAAEIAAVVLILTSQAWNMTFSFYQSMTTIPQELREAAAIFRLSAWQRLTTLELPFAALGLVWNSMMSWAGGWFFLMAAEIFTIGARDFRLPGLGAYLQVAASRGDLRAVLFGVGTLVLVIVLLDQVVWRPVLAWADKFKLEMTAGDQPPESWCYNVMSRAWLLERFEMRLWRPFADWVDRCVNPLAPTEAAPSGGRARTSPLALAGLAVFVLASAFGAWKTAGMLAELPAGSWGRIGMGLLATFGRVAVSLAVALLWTIPVGVAIGTNRRLATILQPIVQVIASVPATALFPVLLLALLRQPGGLDVAAILLMLMGTQWYLLFNIIAGASAIPQDLRMTTDLLRLSRFDRWRTLILPALFPYIITGSITASGGAWNASIVAEHVDFAGSVHATRGIGAIISQATAEADYPLLLAGTLALIVSVVAINRTFWRWLYQLARDRYRME
jgi:NitT/TauT family transport system permease protein